MCFGSIITIMRVYIPDIIPHNTAGANIICIYVQCRGIPRGDHPRDDCAAGFTTIYYETSATNYNYGGHRYSAVGRQ